MKPKINRAVLLQILTRLPEDQRGKKPVGFMLRYANGNVGEVDTGELVQWLADKYDQNVPDEDEGH